MSSSYSSFYSKKYPVYKSNYNYINPPKCKNPNENCIISISKSQSSICCVNPIIIYPCFNILVQCENFTNKKNNYTGNDLLYYQQFGINIDDEYIATLN